MAGEWITDASLATVRRLWDEGVSTARIGDRVGTTKNAIVGIARRLALPARPTPIRRNNVGGHRNGLGSIALWVTPERIELLREHWPTYKSIHEILALMTAAEGAPLPKRSTVSSYANCTLRLNRPADFHTVVNNGRPKAVQLHRAEARSAVLANYIKAKADPPRVSRPQGVIRQAVFSVGSIDWRVIQGIKIEHEPGCCRWPLVCDGHTVSRFCDAHAGLLRSERRAA